MANPDFELYEEILSCLERGLQLVKTNFDSASLQVKEAIIEVTETLTSIAVMVEPLLPTVDEDVAIIISQL